MTNQMYNVDSLKQGIVKANANIAMFKDAIQKEKDTIEEYKMMIDVIEKKKSLHDETHKTIEAERE